MKLAAAVLVGILLVFGQGVACECEPHLPLSEALAANDFVLSGRVLALEGEFELKDAGGSAVSAEGTSSADLIGWAIMVDQVWKGVEADTVIVYTRRGVPSCGYPFKQGESYLIYGNYVSASAFLSRYEMQRGVPGAIILDVSLCSRTSELGRASEDLAILAKPKWDRMWQRDRSPD
ncbi:hypothetical protein KJ682_10065 [bacterium]|nr:hypothetical protein [bacterium]